MSQTQIPQIKTDNDALNQIQQNVNKVLRGLVLTMTDLSGTLRDADILGEIKFSPLTLVQFQDQAGTAWVFADGASCVGTKYSRVYNQNTLPVVTIPGTNSFIKVN